MNQVASAVRPDWVSDDMYPFESRFFATPSGHRMHFVDEGEGEPLVFVHGNPTWSFEFRHLIAGLRSGFRCVAPDHVGFGLSSRSDRREDHHPESHANRFAAFLDHLDLRDITLFMTDWGGPIGLDFARRQPERVRRLVIANTWCWPGAAHSGRRCPPLPRRRSSHDTGAMELSAVRSFHFRRPSAEALTWLVTATMLAAGSLLPEPNAGMLITVAHGLLALLPVVAVAALLAGALTLGNWSDRALSWLSWLSWLSGGPVRAVVIASLVGSVTPVCGLGALPLVRGLMEKGMGFGAALALMISGAVVSLCAAVAVASIVRIRVFVLYVLLAVTGACGAGLAAAWLV